MKKFDVSVILPIKSSKAIDFDDYFNKSIESIKKQKSQINELIIVHTNETSLVEFLKSFDFGEIEVKMIEWTEEANYAKQINEGVKNAKSKWVSLFEFDDEYSNIWFDNVDIFSKAHPDVEVFLPIVVDTDEKGLFVGFTNEASFAMNISDEIGILKNETLQQYQNFQISGMVVKKETFLSWGGIKSSFRLTFGYEFFLRLTHNSVKIMTVPRIGYKHMNLRTGSIFWNYKNSNSPLTNDEVKFWVDSAKKEYFFINDRDIKYEIKNS